MARARAGGLGTEALRVDLKQAVGPIEQTEFASFILLLCLLTTQCHLGGHDALSLGDKRALGTGAVSPATVALVTFECRHDAVVATACTLGRAGIPLTGSCAQLQQCAHGALAISHTVFSACFVHVHRLSMMQLMQSQDGCIHCGLRQVILYSSKKTKCNLLSVDRKI